MAMEQNRSQSDAKFGQVPFLNQAGMGNGGSAIPRSFEQYFQQIQEILHDVQNVFSETSNHQIDDLFSANRRLIEAMNMVSQSRNPRDLLSAQSQVTGAMLDTMTSNAQVWAHILRRVQECCVSIAEATQSQAEEAGEEMQDQAGQFAETMRDKIRDKDSGKEEESVQEESGMADWSENGQERGNKSRGEGKQQRGRKKKSSHH